MLLGLYHSRVLCSRLCRHPASHHSNGNVGGYSAAAASQHSRHHSQREYAHAHERARERERDRSSNHPSTKHSAGQRARSPPPPHSASAAAEPLPTSSHKRPLPSTYAASVGSMSMPGMKGRQGFAEEGLFSGPPSTIGEESDSDISGVQTAGGVGTKGRERREVDGVAAVAGQLQAQV
eukprot:1160082-Pelagomonas_calceolata.AAC.4